MVQFIEFEQLNIYNLLLYFNQKKGRLPKSKQVLEDIDVSKPATDLTDETTVSESITKKNCDSLPPKGNILQFKSRVKFNTYRYKYSKHKPFNIIVLKLKC